MNRFDNVYLKSRSCTSKRRYIEKRLAKRAARIMHKKSGETLRAYKCDFCDVYHVGHPKGYKRHIAEDKKLSTQIINKHK